MVEGGGRKRNEAAVPARAASRNLHCAHQPNFGKAGSQPRGHPRHHPRGDAKLQATALFVEEETGPRGATRLIIKAPAESGNTSTCGSSCGHMLAHRPRQEGSDGSTPAPSVRPGDKPSVNYNQTLFKSIPNQNRAYVNRLETLQNVCFGLHSLL